MGKHGGFWHAGCAAGELEVAHQMRKHLGLDLVQEVRVDPRPLRQQVLVGGVSLGVTAEDDHLGP